MKVICDCHDICESTYCTHRIEHKHTSECELVCNTLYKMNGAYYSSCKATLKTIRKEKLKKLNYVRKN